MVSKTFHDAGKPAWLDLAKVPPPKELQCPHCALPLTFLLQVNNLIPQCLKAPQLIINMQFLYCYIFLISWNCKVYSPDNNSDSAFHRSLFVFLCVASPCWDQGKEPPVLALRSHHLVPWSFWPMFLFTGASWAGAILSTPGSLQKRETGGEKI